jgi:hypothetical protein
MINQNQIDDIITRYKSGEALKLISANYNKDERVIRRLLKKYNVWQRYKTT